MHAITGIGDKRIEIKLFSELKSEKLNQQKNYFGNKGLEIFNK
jgi:hypothetical protein